MMFIGDVHTRQRRVMYVELRTDEQCLVNTSVGFRASEVPKLNLPCPYFPSMLARLFSLKRHSNRAFTIPQLSAKWTDMISNESSEQVDVDVHYWLSRAALDAIGEGKQYYFLSWRFKSDTTI